MELLEFNRAQYAEHVRGLINVQLHQLGDFRRVGEQTPEWIAACDDIEIALCSLAREQLDDELQLPLFEPEIGSQEPEVGRAA